MITKSKREEELEAYVAAETALSLIAFLILGVVVLFYGSWWGFIPVGFFLYLTMKIAYDALGDEYGTNN